MKISYSCSSGKHQKHCKIVKGIEKKTVKSGNPSSQEDVSKNKFELLKFGRNFSVSNSKPYKKNQQQQEKVVTPSSVHSIRHYQYPIDKFYTSKKSEETLFINFSQETITQVKSHHVEAEFVNNTSPKEVENQIKDKGSTKICFENLPQGTSISSVVSQISGGALKSIKVVDHVKGTPKRKNIYIEFKDKENTKKFLTYCNTTHFKINGCHFKPRSSFDNFVQIPLNNTRFYNVNDISRSVVLKQHSNRVRKIPRFHGYDTPLYPLNIVDIKKDFSIFGDIIEVSPLISRKLCVSIFYSNISSAIQAIEEYQRDGSLISRKYAKGWTIWFGKDTTDTPCLNL